MMHPTRRETLRCGINGIVGASIGTPGDLLRATVLPTDKPDGRIRFGINYIPRKNWWYNCQDLDAQLIADDFKAIVDLKRDHTRIHCLWHFFQRESVM